jgi:hypothetical protein
MSGSERRIRRLLRMQEAGSVLTHINPEHLPALLSHLDLSVPAEAEFYELVRAYNMARHALSVRFKVLGVKYDMQLEV